MVPETSYKRCQWQQNGKFWIMSDKNINDVNGDDVNINGRSASS